MLLSMGIITLLTQVVPGCGSRLGSLQQCAAGLALPSPLPCELRIPQSPSKLLATFTPQACRGIVPVPGDLLRGGIFGGSGSSSKDSIDLASLSEFERQLYGCRSLKSGPIPFVDTEASLRVLDGLSDEQQQTADAYTAALATCTDFACLQRAHQLVRAHAGMAAAWVRTASGQTLLHLLLGCTWPITEPVVHCLHPTRLQPRAPGQFNFPHFMVIGFPKCATTSLYW